MNKNLWRVIGMLCVGAISYVHGENSNDTTLFDLIRGNKFDQALERLASNNAGKILNARDADNSTLMVAAVKYFDSKKSTEESLYIFLNRIIVKLNAGGVSKETQKAFVNRQNKQGKTALMFAAQKDLRIVLQLLRRMGASVLPTDDSGHQASYYTKKYENLLFEWEVDEHKGLSSKEDPEVESLIKEFEIVSH